MKQETRMIQTAFLPAAGFGKRMGRLTENTPKPLLKVGGYPLIYYSLFQLYLWNIKECIVNLHYLSDQIEAELRNFPYFNIFFSHEAEILGTAGGIKTGLDSFRQTYPDRSINKPILVMNPDNIFITDLNLVSILSALPDNFEACLFMKQNDNNEHAGWSRMVESCRVHTSRQKSKREEPELSSSLRNDEENYSIDPVFRTSPGELYYIGAGIINPQSLQNLTINRFYELGAIWKERPPGTLYGLNYRGIHIPCNTEADYKHIRSLLPVPKTHADRWKEFLQGWLSSSDETARPQAEPS